MERNNDFFELSNRSPEQAYFLGWLITDGNIMREKNKKTNDYILKGVCFKLKKTDENYNILTILKNNIDESININIHTDKEYKYKPDSLGYVKIRKKAHAYRVAIYSKKLAQDAGSIWGIHPAKTNSEDFNKLLENCRPEDYPHLLRGIIEGDGCFTCGINKNNKRFRKCSILGNLNFLTQIKDFLISRGITSQHIGICKGDGNIYQLEIGNYQGIVDIGTYIYSQGGHRLEYKYQKFCEIRDNFKPVDRKKED